MSSNLRVNNILPSVGTNVAIGTAGGSITLTGSVTGSSITNTGVTTVAAGSTSAPSISPSGDSNTGIFFPSADTVAIAEGGVEVLRIDSSGRVGVGTDNPSQKLHVRSVIRIDGSTNPYIVLNDGTNTGYIQIADGRLDLNHNGNISFAPGGGVKATINTSGNLVFAGSGQGIDFSATANSSGTMTSELLSDYEEGTWTPSLTDSSNSSVYSSGTRYGNYTKVGRIVIATAVFDNVTCISGTAIRVSNLPFTVTSDTTRYPAFNSHTTGTAISGTTIHGGYARPGETNFQLIQRDSFNTVNFSNGNLFMFITMIYAV